VTWRTIRLGDYVEERRETYEPRPDEALPYLGLEHIEQDTLHIAEVGCSADTHSTKRVFSAGDVLFGSLRPYFRKVVRPRFSGVCSTDITVLRAKDGFDHGFLHYFIADRRFIDYATNISSGTRMPRANWKTLAASAWRVPSLAAQRKIASILGAYDDLIENNLRRIQILEEMARLLYREWFVHYRFPGHEGVRMVDSPLGKIPEGWEIARVADVAYIQRGRSYRGKDIVEEGLPFYNLKCVDRGGDFRIEGIKRYTGRYKDSQTARPGDILVAVTDMTQERNIVAEAARIPDTGEEFGVFSMDLVKVTPGTGTPPEYLYGMLRFSPFSEEVKQYANGVNVLHLSPDRFAEYEFPIATDALRCRYADAVRPAYREVDILTRKNETLCVARDLLLPRLISGELDV